MIADSMGRFGSTALVWAAILAICGCLSPAWAQDKDGSSNPSSKEPPAATAPQKPGDPKAEPKEPEDGAESFDRGYGPGCPYRERDLKPLLVLDETSGADPAKLT